MSYLGFSPTQRLYGTATYTTVSSDGPTTTGVLPFTVYPEALVIVNGSVLYPNVDYTVNATTNVCTLTSPASVGVDILTLNLALFSMVGSAYTFGNSTNVFNVSTAISATNATPLSQVQGLISQNRSTRLTVQTGTVDSFGQASYIGVGTGLAPLMSATTIPVNIAFAQGMTDYVETISVDTSYPTVPANVTSFLYATRVSVGNVTFGSTLAPPQYDYSYNQTVQSKLDLNNTNLDDFGNTWTNTAVTFTNTSPMLTGTYMGVFNGTTSTIKAPFSTLYPVSNTGFSLRAFGKTTSLSSVQTLIFAGTSYGLQLAINTSGKTLLYLSSTGSSWDIASATTGTVTIATGTSYFIELTQDPIAGKYYLYVNGVLDQTITSTAKICPISNIYVGSVNGSSTFWTGNIQGFEFLPYCQHPAGTTYTVPSTLSTVVTVGYSADWVNISNGITVNQVSAPSTIAGNNPTFTTVNRVYQGECISGASAITSTVSYVFNSRYDSGLFAVTTGVSYNKNHNLGTAAYNIDVTMADDAFGTNERLATHLFWNSGYIGWDSLASSRNFTSLATGAFGVGLSVVGAIISSSFFRVRIRRPF